MLGGMSFVFASLLELAVVGFLSRDPPPDAAKNAQTTSCPRPSYADYTAAELALKDYYCVCVNFRQFMCRVLHFLIPRGITSVAKLLKLMH